MTFVTKVLLYSFRCTRWLAGKLISLTFYLEGKLAEKLKPKELVE